MKKISIIVACYNEALNIEALYNRVCNVFKNLNYDFEIIYVDNSSTDNSEEIFESLAKRDSRVKAILMSRNFGSSQPSFWAGISNCIGNCAILIDGDLQDPPELICDLLKKWEEGYDVVYAVRVKRKGNILRRIGYKCFYRIFKWFSYLNIPLDSGDFGLIDKKVIDIFKIIGEKDLYIRGLRSWVGFKQIGVNYIRDDRAAGKTSNSFLANFYWAKKAIVNFSYKPLEFVSRVSFFSVLITFFVMLFYIYLHFKTDAPRGFSTLLLFIFIFGTLQLLALGIISEYLIRIFQEVKNRPPYIISKILENKNDKG